MHSKKCLALLGADNVKVLEKAVVNWHVNDDGYGMKTAFVGFNLNYLSLLSFKCFRLLRSSDLAENLSERRRAFQHLRHLA